MRNIIVAEALSTGYNFIEDIVCRGYRAVVLECKATGIMAVDREETYKKIKYPFEIIRECDTYEETVELVKSYNPVIIIPGTESGVIMANRLSESLGLPGNPTSILDSMTRKDAMHEALKRGGVRYIRGRVVSNVEEAEQFLSENHLERGVVKPLQGAGSQGLALCDSREEVLEHVRTSLRSSDFYGNAMHEVLVQERIVGSEYIVNTAVSAGKPRLTSMLVYDKIRTSEGGYIYRFIESISELSAGQTEIVEYAFETVKAIGIQYGMVHGEYMVDEKGPVLIEVNCRPMGCSQPAEYMDLIYGQHETDSILDAYLQPEKFAEEAKRPYRLRRKGAMKLMVIPRNIESESLSLWKIAENLRSTYKIALAPMNETRIFNKTVDLETAGGLIYLVHDDENVVMDDLRLLCELEQKYFSLLYNDGASRPWFIKKEGMPQDIEKVLADTRCMGSTLVVTENPYPIENVMVAKTSELDSIYFRFDQVVICLTEELLQLKEADCLDRIFKAMKLVKEGGRVIIPESTYQYLTYTRNGAETLLRVLRFRIEAPKPDCVKYVIGTR